MLFCLGRFVKRLGVQSLYPSRSCDDFSGFRMAGFFSGLHCWCCYVPFSWQQFFRLKVNALFYWTKFEPSVGLPRSFQWQGISCFQGVISCHWQGPTRGKAHHRCPWHCVGCPQTGDVTVWCRCHHDIDGEVMSRMTLWPLRLTLW